MQAKLHVFAHRSACFNLVTAKNAYKIANGLLSARRKVSFAGPKWWITGEGGISAYIYIYIHIISQDCYNQLRPQNQSRKQRMNSQRAAGQDEAKVQQNPQPQARLVGALWVLECAFASPWPAARCESIARGPGVDFAFGVDFGDLLSVSEPSPGQASSTFPTPGSLEASSF